jgi:hypothetical protein
MQNLKLIIGKINDVKYEIGEFADSTENQLEVDRFMCMHKKLSNCVEDLNYLIGYIFTMTDVKHHELKKILKELGIE